jgi:hypothetical protein
MSGTCHCVKGHSGVDCSKANGVATAASGGGAVSLAEVDENTIPNSDNDNDNDEEYPDNNDPNLRSSSPSPSSAPVLLDTPTTPTTTPNKDNDSTQSDSSLLDASSSSPNPNTPPSQTNTHIICPAECLVSNREMTSSLSSSPSYDRFIEVPMDSHARSVPTYTVALGGFVAGAFVSLLIRWVLDKRQQRRTRAIMTSLTERP